MTTQDKVAFLLEQIVDPEDSFVMLSEEKIELLGYAKYGRHARSRLEIRDAAIAAIASLIASLTDPRLR